MESDLRNLIGKYGMRAVHEGLMKEMRDTFQYLHDVFAVNNEIVHPVHHHIVPTVEVVNNVIPQVFHSETVEEEDSLAEEETVAEMSQDPNVKVIPVRMKSVEAAIVQAASQSEYPKEKTKDERAAEKKKKQDTIEKKRQENLANGIKPESLLTESNLKKWIVTEKKSYSKIAEETGNKEAQVSAAANLFGLESEKSNKKKQNAIKRATKKPS